MCLTQQTYVSSIYNVASSGSYASLFYYNVAGATISSFVHYNKFDQLYNQPVIENTTPAPETTTVTTKTTISPTNTTTTPTTTTTTSQTFCNIGQIFTIELIIIINQYIYNLKACGIPSVQPKLVGGIFRLEYLLDFK